MKNMNRGYSLLELVFVIAIVLVLATMAIPQLNAMINNYRINDAGRQLQATATLAHFKAAARNTRYRVLVSASANTYTLQYCTDWVSTRVNPCSSWGLDSTSTTITLPVGVTFSTTGLTTAPNITCTTAPCTTVTQATEMTFNSRGLLFDETANNLANNRCFYIAGGAKPIAVCSVITGRTVAYLLSGTTWVEL
jgi:prepilin-type N-terminal cleavage/methylation domain-containing protein